MEREFLNIPYFPRPLKQEILEKDLPSQMPPELEEKYVFEEEMKKYEKRVGISERLEMLEFGEKEIKEKIEERIKETGEELSGIWSSILDERLSEFRDTIERRITEEIDKIIKSLPKPSPTIPVKPKTPLKETYKTETLEEKIKRLPKKEGKEEVIKKIKEWKKENWTEKEIRDELRYWNVNPDDFKEYIK